MEIWVSVQLREAVANLFSEDNSHYPRAVVNPGAYRRVCVSLRVHHLAVNALVAAATMSEMEGGNLNDDPGEHAWVRVRDRVRRGMFQKAALSV